jgi:hypothetical protein
MRCAAMPIESVYRMIFFQRDFCLAMQQASVLHGWPKNQCVCR